MIDIIVQIKNNELNLEKALMSIFLQEIDVPYSVTIIGNKIDKQILNRFNKFYKVNFIEKNNNNIKELILDNKNNPYIVFLDTNTVFFNVESLQRLYNRVKEKNKNIYGKTLINNNNEQDELNGNIYKRETLMNTNDYESISNLICISNKKE